jgi:hypothetical protein
MYFDETEIINDSVKATGQYIYIDETGIIIDADKDTRLYIGQQILPWLLPSLGVGNSDIVQKRFETEIISLG